MEKVDIAQQRRKSSHSAAVWNKETYCIMEKEVIAQQR